MFLILLKTLHSKQMIRTISLPASKVAAMVGKNPYCKISEIYDEMKCRITGEKVKTLNDTQPLNKNELIKLFKNLHPNKIMKQEDLNLERILKLSCNSAIKCKTTTECLVIEKDIKEKIANIFPEKNLQLVGDFITKDINTNRGTRNENKIIQNYNKRHVTIITDNNSQLYKYPLVDIKGSDGVLYKFHISAKIDGLQDNILIEVKNRRNRLFTKIPKKEKIQMEIYLRILNLDTAKLVQNFNDTSSELLYNADDVLWNYILDNLCKFTSDLLRKE